MASDTGVLADRQGVCLVRERSEEQEGNVRQRDGPYKEGENE